MFVLVKTPSCKCSAAVKSVAVMYISDRQKKQTILQSHSNAAVMFLSAKTVNMLGMWGWWGVLSRCWDSLGSWRSHYHTKATLLGNLSRRCSLARGACGHTLALPQVPHYQPTHTHTHMHPHTHTQRHTCTQISLIQPLNTPLRSPWQKHCLYSDMKYLHSGNINHRGQL